MVPMTIPAIAPPDTQLQELEPVVSATRWRIAWRGRSWSTVSILRRENNTLNIPFSLRGYKMRARNWTAPQPGLRQQNGLGFQLS